MDLFFGPVTIQETKHHRAKKHKQKRRKLDMSKAITPSKIWREVKQLSQKIKDAEAHEHIKEMGEQEKRRLRGKR